MTDGGGLIILETVVNMVHIAAAYQVVPPADLVHVDLGPGYGLGLGHALVIFEICRSSDPILSD